MFTILKNVKYLLFFLLFISWELGANHHEKLALHGGYTFETGPEQKATAVYLSFFNNGEKEIEIESFSTNVANFVGVKPPIKTTFINYSILKTNIKASAYFFPMRPPLYFARACIFFILLEIKLAEA